MKRDVLREYLDKLLSEYHYLDFRGIMQLEKVVELELDDVFVPLNAVPLVGQGDEKVNSLRAFIESGTHVTAELGVPNGSAETLREVWRAAYQSSVVPAASSLDDLQAVYAMGYAAESPCSHVPKCTATDGSRQDSRA